MTDTCTYFSKSMPKDQLIAVLQIIVKSMAACILISMHFNLCFIFLKLSRDRALSEFSISS